QESFPRGPSIESCWPETPTLTPEGTATGCFPIRDMARHLRCRFRACLIGWHGADGVLVVFSCSVVWSVECCLGWIVLGPDGGSGGPATRAVATRVRRALRPLSYADGLRDH